MAFIGSVLCVQVIPSVELAAVVVDCTAATYRPFPKPTVDHVPAIPVVPCAQVIPSVERAVIPVVPIVRNCVP